MNQRLTKLIIPFLSVIFLSSCLNFGGGLVSSYNFPSVGESSGPSDSEYFYIDLDRDQYKSAGALVPFYEISTTTEYGDSKARESLSNCEIAYEPSEEEGELEEQSASEDNLICILDFMEYEFMVNDIHVNYNFPEGMCDYIRFSLPWHFNHAILEGPTVVEKKCPPNPAEGAPACTDQVCDGDTAGPCVDADKEEELCPNQNAGIAGTNVVRCCSGGERSDGSTWRPDIQCFGGPAVIAEIEGADITFYESILEELPEGGLNGTITLPDLTSINGAEKLSHPDYETGFTTVSSPFVNYLKALDRSPDRLENVRRTDLPPFLQSNPHYNHRPEPFFTFECLDRAGEVLHKILLMIREWNTYSEFKEFYDEGGNDSADPDVEGLEGDECEFEDRRVLDGEGESCNDLLDLDDIVDCQDYAWCLIFNKEPAGYPRIRYSPNTSEEAGETEEE